MVDAAGIIPQFRYPDDSGNGQRNCYALSNLTHDCLTPYSVLRVFSTAVYH
jgi:hypothetical protein